MGFCKYALLCIYSDKSEAHPHTATPWRMYNSYSPFLSLSLSLGSSSRCSFCTVSWFLLKRILLCAFKFLFDGEEPENSVGELQEQTYQEEEDVNANKPCVTAREGIYFFSVRLELSLGILQRRRYVSSVERLSCTLDPRCIKFNVLPRWISSTLSWLLFIQHLLLHIPKVKMAEMSRTICTRALWVCTHHFWHSIHLVWLIYWFNLSTVSSRR